MVDRNHGHQVADEAKRAFGALLQAQQNFALESIRMDEARALRDQAIIDAAAVGFPRRALAQATSLTPGRVQQIIDLARDRPEEQPALQLERDRRQRSQALNELVRRHAQGELD
jgi:hypothetical protein